MQRQQARWPHGALWQKESGLHQWVALKVETGSEVTKCIPRTMFVCSKTVHSKLVSYRPNGAILQLRQTEDLPGDNLTNQGNKVASSFHQHSCWNFTECFRLQFLYRATYSGTFLPNAAPIKSIKNYMRKSCSALAQFPPPPMVGADLLTTVKSFTVTAPGIDSPLNY